MVFIDFCCLLQKLTNASAVITAVIQTLLVRIPWAHTFALAKLDSMEMEKSALVSITILFLFSRPLHSGWLLSQHFYPLRYYILIQYVWIRTY